MLKRIILFLGILFYTLGAETLTTTDDKQWQSYFGVEGGVGLMDIEPAFLASANAGLLNTYYLRGISYGGGILGGWQKYTYEKVGMRNTLGLRVFGSKAAKVGDDKFKERKGEITVDTTFYYALDGLFDFVKNGENRFGMNLGFAVDVLHLSFLKDLKGVGAVTLSARLGFYTQFNYNVIELIATSPLISVGGGKVFAYNSTLTLGYKYLF